MPLSLKYYNEIKIHSRVWLLFSCTGGKQYIFSKLEILVDVRACRSNCKKHKKEESANVSFSLRFFGIEVHITDGGCNAHWCQGS